MTTLLNNFSNENWYQSVDSLEGALREELHNGLIKDYRDSFEKVRQTKLSDLNKNFQSNVDINKIDEQLNEYTLGIKKTNLYNITVQIVL